MDRTNGLFNELSNLFKLGKYDKCIQELKKCNHVKWESPGDQDFHNRIIQSNRLLCECLENNLNGKYDNDESKSTIRSFYSLMKESIFKSETPYFDLVVINNILQFCCCTEVKTENVFSGYDCLFSVVFALKKVMFTFIGKDFKPPLAIEIDDPVAELTTLIEDILKSLQKCEPVCRLLLASAVALLLQDLFVMNGGHSCKNSSIKPTKGWERKVLEMVSHKVPEFIQLLKSNDTKAGPKPKYRTDGKSETQDIGKLAHESIPLGEKHYQVGILESMPVFTCDVLGDCVTLQDYWEPCGKKIEVNDVLLFTLCLINQFFGGSPADEEVLLYVEETLTNYFIVGSWKYVKGYLYLKDGKLEEAMLEMNELDFSKLPVHFKSKKAILTGSILSRMGKYLMALTVFNSVALDCEDCLPQALLCLSEAYECLGCVESLLQTLRHLVKVLKHRNHLENLRSRQYPMFFKTLDLIHPAGVNLELALEKLASKLAQNKLYEESVEYFLDLLALLEKTGPAKNFRYHLHNATAALLLLSENSEVDRTKEAISLCNRAASVFQIPTDHLEIPHCSVNDNTSNEPTASKRPRLELEVNDVFLEVDSARSRRDQMDVECDSDDFDHMKGRTLEDEEDCIGELDPASICASLSFSKYDLMSCILLSECALREGDFSKSLQLLNRCLQNLSHHQLLERGKKIWRNDFLKTTDFVLSYLWLKKAKVLMKKEVSDSRDFGKDIEHCFRNALMKNSGNAEIKFYYVNYLIGSAKGKENTKEILSMLEQKTTFGGVLTMTNLAIWYAFQCQITKHKFEHLKEKVKELK